MNELSDRIYRDFTAGQEIGKGKKERNWFSFSLNCKETAEAVSRALSRCGSYAIYIFRAILVRVL